MRTSNKYQFILAGAVLALVMLACHLPTVTPALTVPPTSPAPLRPTVSPRPTASPSPTSQPIPAAQPLPELEGYWQISARVITIAWQDNQYMVTGITDASEGSLEVIGQSWNGSSLSFTYNQPSSDTSITYTTISVSGDKLFASWSNTDGDSGTLILLRVASGSPSYYSLPYVDDFSDPNSGWDIFNASDGGTGYANGYYYSISKTKNIIETGYAYRYFGDTVIEVDATSASGPSNDAFGYVVSCRLQKNYGTYAFEVDADGYYSVWVFTNADTSTPLLSGNGSEYSSAINQGLASNHLVVTCAGSQLKLEVNGLVLFEGQDSTYSNGDIGLGAVTWDDNNTPAEVHFDNLVVTAP